MCQTSLEEVKSQQLENLIINFAPVVIATRLHYSVIQVGDKEAISLQETDRTRNGAREERTGTGEARGVWECCFARPARFSFLLGCIVD